MVWPAIIAAAGTIGAALLNRNSNKASISAMEALANRPSKTKLGSFYNPTGESGFAPFLQNQQTGILDNLPGYKSSLTQGFGNFQNRLQDTRSELVGNESQFMQSGLNPIRQRQASAEGALTRDLSRRGIEGSSFANTARGNQQATFGRELSDATAQIRNQQLAQRLGIDEAALNASTGLVNNLASLDRAQMANVSQIIGQEFKLFGLNQGTIDNLLQVGGLNLQNQQNFYNQLGRGAMGIGSMFENSSSAPLKTTSAPAAPATSTAITGM